MPDGTSVRSARQIDEAGRCLRLALEGRVEGRLSQDPFKSAVGVVWSAADIVRDHRMSFTGPLAAVEAKLRPLIAEVAESAEPPTGRPKRLIAIVEKLVRLRGMRLTQMEDIAGLRVVLPNGSTEVQALLGRIRSTWPDAKHKDYVTEPKKTGYRAIHAFVSEDDRTVEIQLRTPSQNRWADEVEAAASRLNYLLKDGEGPEDLVRYFERAAYKLATEEQGGEPDEAFRRNFEILRQEVRPYFARHDP